jgi:hypothetical protein
MSKINNLISRASRAKAFECFIDGKTLKETMKICQLTRDKISIYFEQFSRAEITNPENTFIRLGQAKNMSAELLRMIAHGESPEKIEDLKIKFSQFSALD